MAKPTKPPQSSASPFDALLSRKTSAPEQADSQTAKQSDSHARLAKSADPAYIKFTTYVRKTTHRAVKVKLAQDDREFSDLVEELLRSWLERQSDERK